jgi:hypothetical protein
MAQAICHDGRTTGCIQYHVRESSIRSRQGFDTRFLRKLSAPIVDFYDCHFRPDGGRELTHRQSDRTSPDHQHLLARPQLASLYGMSPNSQRLDQCELIKREPLGFVQEFHRDTQEALHTSVDMYTDQPKMFAAIRSSHSASAALAATHIRFDRAPIARAESSPVLWHFYDLASKFVSQDPWICVYRMPSGKSMKITSADPDSMNSNQGLSTGGHWARDLEVDKLARSI